MDDGSSMLDAIIISDSGADTFSASSPLRLQIDGKIALIQYVRNYLDHNGQLTNPVRGEHEKNWHVAPKLNGIMLYSHLHHEGFTTALIDSYYQEREQFIKLLQKKPRAVIISTTFILNKAALARLAEDIRALAPDIYIIAGGPFVYTSYLLLQRASDQGYDLTSPQDDYLFLNFDQRPDIDLYIIDKSGLQVLSQALKRMTNGQSVDSLPNTVRWDGQVYSFATRQVLPPPDVAISWDCLPDNIFDSGTMNIQASIGCPHHCEFCNFVKDAKYTFIKPLDLLVKELKEITGRGVRYIRFVDDNFRLGRNDLNDVCRRFIQEGLEFKWMSFLRASALVQTDFDLLKKAGCIEVQIGIESADKTVLQNMNKQADTEMYQRVITELLRKGINCSCCFLVGFPGETEDSFQRTIDFINAISNSDLEGIFSWSIYPFLLAPLSPIYETSKRALYGLEGYMQKWEHETMNSSQARQLIIKAFHQIDKAGPIYSGDNIDMLLELSPRRRKEFMRIRHSLSKRFLIEPFDRSLVLESFSKIFD
jgi:p-methyltransferase